MKNIKFKNNYNFERIKLEKLSIRDLDDIHEYSKDEKFFKYLEYKKYKKKDETKKYIKDKIKQTKKGDNFWWAIKLKNVERTIGTICIYNINFCRKSCEIGYGINPKYWHKGYFSETLKYLLNIIMQKNRFLRCQAITASNNISSIKGLIKCGFKKEGILKNYYRYRDKNKSFDATILSKIKN